MSGSTPPLLPARGNSKVVPSAPLSPSSVLSKKCNCSRGACEHCYQRIVLPHEADENHYETLSMAELDMDTRLRKLEDNQIRIRLELSQLRDDVTSRVQSLQMSMIEITNTCKGLDCIIRESSTLLQVSIDKMHQRLLENSDHLGKQIMDVRRDVLTSSKSTPSKSKK